MRSTTSQRALRRKLDPTGKQQDCLGMNPLHILACSTVQNIELYRVLVESYPENLVAKDKWGASPLFYAVWRDAPIEILQFLVDSYQSIYPDYELNWTVMFETLGGATQSNVIRHAPLRVIQNLLRLQQESFPKQSIDWDRVLDRFISLRYPKETFRFLTECSISKRVNAIGVRRFRLDVADLVKSVPSNALSRKEAWFSDIKSKLANYES